MCRLGKSRFTKDGFDLDLTYITRRIVAMSLPSTGKTSLFRNAMYVVYYSLFRSSMQALVIGSWRGVWVDCTVVDVFVPFQGGRGKVFRLFSRITVSARTSPLSTFGHAITLVLSSNSAISFRFCCFTGIWWRICVQNTSTSRARSTAVFTEYRFRTTIRPPCRSCKSSSKFTQTGWIKEKQILGS